MPPGALHTLTTGALFSLGPMVTDFNGGGIENLRTLTITGCTFSGNSATFGPGGSGDGGGIQNQDTLTITASTFSGNSGIVGGIYNHGTLTVTASTFSGNSAQWGGGIANG